MDGPHRSLTPVPVFAWSAGPHVIRAFVIWGLFIVAQTVLTIRAPRWPPGAFAGTG